jgi:hypothetical protein
VGQAFCLFARSIAAGYVLFCVPKENQKGRRCPQGMKAPVGLLSRRPVCKAYAVCRYDPSREKVNQKNPQIFLIYKLKIKFPLNMARAERRPF